MTFAFFKYFLFYVFRGQTRQNLIFLTIIGLLISSFSLVVLQGIMGGLQSGLIKRSKKVLGTGHFDVRRFDQEKIDFLLKDLAYKKVKFIPELEIELMIQNGSYLAPLIVHGWSQDFERPDFLKEKDFEGLILGSKVASELGAYFDSQVTLTSPAHTTVLMREIPRQGSLRVSDFYSSELPEIDGIHGWVRLSFLQNMIRKRKINKVRIFSPISALAPLFKQENGYYSKDDFTSWEEVNSTLVWALNLETKVMLFIFTSMSILIGICIVSGYLIFYNKIKIDLASFWILGLPKDRALKLAYRFGYLLTATFSLLGVGLGLLVLTLLDSNKIVFMPEHFVERNIPVNITWESITLSFFVPYLIAFVFTRMTFSTFKKENISFISLIKKVG